MSTSASAVLPTNVETFIAPDAPREYHGHTFLQGWSTWIAVFIAGLLVLSDIALPDPGTQWNIVIACGTVSFLTWAVHNDLKRTRMSRWWTFWTFALSAFGLGIYLYVRNRRGLRTLGVAED
jgi:hypothetical protein